MADTLKVILKNGNNSAEELKSFTEDIRSIVSDINKGSKESAEKVAMNNIDKKFPQFKLVYKNQKR